jgi:hypothetical protein
MSDEIQTTETVAEPILIPAPAWLAANREALLEMAAWDCENEIFSLEQRLF